MRLVTGPHRQRKPTTQQAAAQSNRRAINPQAAPPPDQIAGGLGAAPPGKARNRKVAARKVTTLQGRGPQGRHPQGRRPQANHPQQPRLNQLPRIQNPSRIKPFLDRPQHANPNNPDLLLQPGKMIPPNSMVMRDRPKPGNSIRSRNLGPPPLRNRISKIPRHQHGEVQRGPSLISMRDMAHHHRIPKLSDQRPPHGVAQLRNPRPPSSGLQRLDTNPSVQQRIPLPRPVEPPMQPRSPHGPPEPNNLVPTQRTQSRSPGPALPPENHQAGLPNPTNPQVLLHQIGLGPGQRQRDLGLVHIGQPGDIRQRPGLGQRPHERDTGLPAVDDETLVSGRGRLGPNPNRNLGDNPEKPFTTKHQLLQVRTGSRSGSGPSNPLTHRRGHTNRLDHVLKSPIPGRRLPSRSSSSKPTNSGPLKRLRHMPEREPVLPQQPLSLRPGDPGLQHGNPRNRINGNKRPKPGQVQRNDSRLGPAQSLDPTDHGRATTKRHHGDVVLDTDPQHLKDFLRRSRLHNSVRHSQLPVPTTTQQVQVRQPTSTPKPIRRIQRDRADSLQRRKRVLGQLRRRHRNRHLRQRLPQPNALTEPSQRMRRQRHGFGGPSSPGHCYSVTHDVSTSHPRRPARRHP
ncbi:hypothetical protein SAMN04488564_11667 [Lentzea waywayandensis]|uniref:Uncharacterized protein n=1 Tax=Lentzea waywayandensis TaxID=84724 RepID=A0A1I6FGA5_9PSEU|nr:hypothetical protein SAMN04488564_11667 [Lentzea waywayandensis]